MKLENAAVLISGANRGIGKALAEEALARGAKVYSGARDSSTVQIPGAIAVELDVNSEASVAAAAAQLQNVTLLINNAGIAHLGGFLDPNGLEEARAQMETNFFGMLRLSHAFAPILIRNGGGAMANVLSIAAWLHGPPLSVYAASKTAAWSLTNALRQELKAHGTQVVGVHVGFVDTDLTHGLEVPKVSPLEVAKATFDGIEAGLSEVLVDEATRLVKQSLSTPQPIYLTGMDLVPAAKGN
jgi:NAD(P)-dependent dehydrogenase (short-subunit alcohol dehydrogenase family)